MEIGAAEVSAGVAVDAAGAAVTAGTAGAEKNSQEDSDKKKKKKMEEEKKKGENADAMMGGDFSIESDWTWTSDEDKKKKGLTEKKVPKVTKAISKEKKGIPQWRFDEFCWVVFHFFSVERGLLLKRGLSLHTRKYIFVIINSPDLVAHVPFARFNRMF